MSLKLSGWEDTIVALATPPGVGAIGVIRLSGKQAIDIVNSMFHKDLHQQCSHTIHVGFLKDKSEVQGRKACHSSFRGKTID